MLGGSSAINAEAFIAPSKADIEAWGSLGNAGWNWDTLLPYYRKFHTLTPPPEETSKHLGIDWIDPNVRGTDGPIQVSFQGVIQDPLSNAWVETFKKLGHGLKSDPFSGQAMGGYSSPLTVDPEAKVRSYAANTYFIAASARQNLHVVTGALTEKILFESKDDLVIAKGVSVNIKGETHTVTARKEVILAAGAFQTPKLLELSGIGNKDLLQSHGIPVMIDNPNVGENLQDHLMTGISIEVNDGIFTGDGMMRQEPEALNGAMQMYATAKAGPLCAGGIGSHAFMSLADATNAKDELAAVLADSPDSEQVNLLRSMVENNQEATGAMFMFPAQVNLHNDPKTKSFVQDLRPGNYLSIGISLTPLLSRQRAHHLLLPLRATQNRPEIPLLPHRPPHPSRPPPRNLHPRLHPTAIVAAKTQRPAQPLLRPPRLRLARQGQSLRQGHRHLKQSPRLLMPDAAARQGRRGQREADGAWDEGAAHRRCQYHADDPTSEHPGDGICGGGEGGGFDQGGLLRGIGFIWWC